jgi:hypothetical protein
MSTIALPDSMALLPGSFATGSDDARPMKRRTPHSAPRSLLSRTDIGAATSPIALTHSRDHPRLATDPATATQAAAAKSP